MSKHSMRRRSDPPPCHALHPDDGIDPRRIARAEEPTAPDRAAERLCGQVARLLSLALGGLAADDALSSVEVLAVHPAPGASRLRVLVTIRDPAADPQHALAKLEAARGFLRSEIAAGICRRRMPDLVFALAAEGRTP